jgi:hypothetical protein
MPLFLLVYNLITYTSAFFVIIPIFIGGATLKRQSIESRTIIALLVVSLLVETLSYFILTANNIILMHIYTFIEFSLLSVFFKLFFGSKFSFKMLFLLICLFLLIAGFDAFFLNDFYTINNFSTSIEAISMIIFSVVAFYFTLKNLLFDNILATPFFWINTAILIYFSGNLFLFLFSNYLQKHQILNYKMLFINHSFLNIVFYILISIGFWKVEKK